MTPKKISIFLLLVAAVIVSSMLTPTKYMASTRKDFNLEKIIPIQFGEWTQYQDEYLRVVNPEQLQLVNKLYSQTISRAYKNAAGNIIMLTIAYGEDQSDNTQLHYPEVCYPAQGFQIASKQKSLFNSVIGPLKIKELVATTSSRVEPLIYWTTVGDKNATNGFESKLIKISYGLKGNIPDGLLFRISSVNPNIQEAFDLEKAFANALITHIDPKFYPILTGLPQP